MLKNSLFERASRGRYSNTHKGAESENLTGNSLLVWLYMKIRRRNLCCDPVVKAVVCDASIPKCTDFSTSCSTCTPVPSSKAVTDEPSSWASATPVGDLDEASGSKVNAMASRPEWSQEPGASPRLGECMAIHMKNFQQESCLTFLSLTF